MIREPFLLQRASLKTTFDSSMKTGDYLNLDYMGSAEFEFGAFPKCQIEIFAKLDKLKIFSTSHNGMELFFLSEEENKKDYSKMLEKLIEGNVRTKGRVALTEKQVTYTKKGKNTIPNYNDPNSNFSFNTWIDLTNNLIFARSPEILENLVLSIPNSIKYMDELKNK
jgi:hypothetical protein